MFLQYDKNQSKFAHLQSVFYKGGISGNTLLLKTVLHFLREMSYLKLGKQTSAEETVIFVACSENACLLQLHEQLL